MRLKFWQFVLCLAIIVYGTYSGFMLYENSQTVSVILGEYISQKPSEEQEITYSLNSNEFTAQDDSLTTFTLTVEYGAVDEFDGENKDYMILVNDGLCQDVVANKGQVTGKYTGVFLNPDGSISFQDELTVEIKYYINNKTVLTLITDGGSRAISFWGQYIALYGMVFQVVEVTA